MLALWEIVAFYFWVVVLEEWDGVDEAPEFGSHVQDLYERVEIACCASYEFDYLFSSPTNPDLALWRGGSGRVDAHDLGLDAFDDDS